MDTVSAEHAVIEEIRERVSLCAARSSLKREGKSSNLRPSPGAVAHFTMSVAFLRLPSVEREKASE